MDRVAAKFDAVLPRIRGSVDRDSMVFTALTALLITATVHALFWLFVGIDQPIADLHQFRQTQTAVTAYWLWRGGPWVAYETPVLGYPWSVPFEFPIYQYLLALLRLIGVPFAEGGRLLSYAFFLGLLWPLRILVKNLGLARTDYLVLSILLLSSPLYVYWSRTVMIESSALFFGACWLAFLIQFMRTEATRDAICAAVFGILAINAKLTTFPGFGIIGGCLFLAAAWRAYRSGLLERNLQFLTLFACIGLLPFATGLIWVAYTDYLKSLNILGEHNTSVALATWNYGTMEQRLSTQFWQGTILSRVVSDTLGFSAIAGLIVIGAALVSSRYLKLAGFSILGFFTPMLMFTNLHMEHNYYQYANALFLLAAVGFGLCAIAHSGRRLLSVVLLTLVVGGQILYFNAGFARVITADYSSNREVLAGAMVKNLTQPGDAIIVVGDDWNPAIAYEAERRALTLAFWSTPQMVNQIFSQPERYLGGAKLGGIVFCADQAQRYQASLPLLQQFLNGRAVLGQAGGCQLLAPNS